MALKSKYITADDFLEYWGVNLSNELPDDDNPSNKVPRFLARVELVIERYLNASFHKLIDVENKTFTNYQKEHYKYALLEQAMYMMRNGDLTLDSGYDIDNGRVDNRAYINDIAISKETKKELLNCGLLTRKITQSRGAIITNGDY